MGKLNQFHATMACSFGSLVMGILNVWPSYTISLYTAQNTTLLSAPMTELEASLLGSLPSLGAMVGTAVAGIIINTIGRKKGGLVMALPFCVSFVIIQQTSSAMVILFARFLAGIAAGAYLVYGPMFISEVAEDSIRGALASGPLTCYWIGALISYLIGWFLSYETVIRINLVAAVFCAILPMTVAESPLYLVRQKREDDARAAISHYRSASPSSKLVLEELSRLKQQVNPAVELVSIKEDIDTKEINTEDGEKEKLNNEVLNVIPEEQEKMSTWKLLFLSPSSRRAFFVVFTVISLQVFMGLVPVSVYAKTLFAQAAPSMSSHFCSVLLAIILVGGCLVAIVVADLAGRRVLIISSSTSVVVCMVASGFLMQTGLLPPFVSAVVILVYCFSFNFGAGSIPYVLLAEVFSSEVQGLASMLLIEWVWFLNFVIIAIFPFMVKLLGMHGVFYLFASFGVANVVCSFVMVPETKGMSNEQIQEVFLKNRRK